MQLHMYMYMYRHIHLSNKRGPHCYVHAHIVVIIACIYVNILCFHIWTFDRPVLTEQVN